MRIPSLFLKLVTDHLHEQMVSPAHSMDEATAPVLVGAHRLLHASLAESLDAEQLLELTVRLVAACVHLADGVLLPAIATAMGEAEGLKEVQR